MYTKPFGLVYSRFQQSTRRDVLGSLRAASPRILLEPEYIGLFLQWFTGIVSEFTANGTSVSYVAQRTIFRCRTTPNSLYNSRTKVKGVGGRRKRAWSRPSEHHYNRVSLLIRNDTCEESADQPCQLLRKSYCNRDQIDDFIAFFGRCPAIQRTYLEW